MNPTPSKGLAVTSLVLGIMSIALCLGILTGIPAIITGHIAHGRSRRHPETHGGGGLAIAGFAMGYLGFAVSLIILPALLLPALAQAKQKAQEINCQAQLKVINSMAITYAQTNNNRFPVSFASLSNLVLSPKVFYCPSDTDGQRADTWADFDGHLALSYEWGKEGITLDDDLANTLTVRCPVHENHCYGNGVVRNTRRSTSGSYY